MYIVHHIKYPLFLSNFNQTWFFSTHFRRMLKYQISWKSVKCEPSFSCEQKDKHGEANSRSS